ncbi:hypothetical protein N0V90_002074 [Kalmusia sp. IMI 367209]|nr:hypothetical protein N0V90_002074 [Kalmusia sp. IMI 367209]
MMEPVTIIGLIANIIQLIEVGREVTSTARDIRKSTSGLTDQAKRFRDYARLVRDDIDQSMNAKNANIVDEKFKAYASSLREQVDIFLDELNSLQVQDKNSLWQPWKAGIKAWWRKDELRKTMRSINQMGDQITMHIVNVLLPGIDSKLDDLRTQNTRMGSNMTGQMQDLRHIIHGLHGQNEASFTLLQAINNWFKYQEELDVQRGCLRALYFREIDSRISNVKHAHADTLGWIFQDAKLDEETNELKKESTFMEWLRSKDPSKNCYWVSGSPGSGKSTLMKFLAYHERVKEGSESWVRGRELLVANYFFWRAGSHRQRSRRGLLETLLFQILSQRRDLIDIAFPKHPWSMIGPEFEFHQDELLGGLKELLHSGVRKNMCFLFFIDGLDEIDERDENSEDVPDEQDLIGLLREIYNSHSVKICVSSRPWAAFESEFGIDSHLCFKMQDLNQADINKYVHDTLTDNETFQGLAHKDQRYFKLAEELTNTAKGVFLWVHLATRILLEGITNSERFCDLQQRLRQLPKRIEDMYQYILDSIPSKYSVSVARYLLLAHVRDRQHPLIEYLYSDEDEYSVAMGKRIIRWDDLYDDLCGLSERISKQSKGLLEIPGLISFPGRSSTLHSEGKTLFKPDGCIPQFAHRTIVEFFCKKHVYRQICDKAGLNTQQPSRLQWDYFIYRVYDAIAHVMFCLLDSTSISDSKDNAILRYRIGLSPSSFVGRKCNPYNFIYKTTDRLSYWGRAQRILDPHYRNSEAIHLGIILLENELISPLGPWQAALVDDTGNHALDYVRMAIDRTSKPLETYGLASLLRYAIYLGQLNVVEALLIPGVDPNVFDPEFGTTYWVAYLQSVYNARWRYLENGASNLILAFLRQGADTVTTFDLYYHEDGKPPEYDYFGRVLTEREDRLEGDKVTFNVADGLRHIFAASDIDIEEHLPEKTDDRETPKEFFIRKGIPNFLDPVVWKQGEEAASAVSRFSELEE